MKRSAEAGRAPTANAGDEARLPSRRDFLTLGMGAFVVAALPLAARRRPQLVRRTVPVMGTAAELAISHRDERYAHAALDAAANELRRVEALLTRFRADSDVGRINAAARGEAVRISGEAGDVIADALRWAAASGGRFDPALGLAVELWDVQRRRVPPPAAAVRRFAGRALHRSIDVERAAAGAVVVRREDDVALDLGGIGKGYGVDRAVAVLREWGIAHALVNAGGDLYALGVAPDGEAWRVGVRSAHAPGGIAATLAVSDAAIATSGDYEQHFEHDGRRFHHLLDPATGEPALALVHSLTVQAPTCIVADAAATALFGAGAAEPYTLGVLARGAHVVHRG
jgi:FAD:protein FMN transferase